ncbi:helix-turn-helix domain-containing protein, partial [Streptomyces sp. p1417]|nr:helix-turn-helix domain-containing protein [Streptomyces typhae]
MRWRACSETASCAHLISICRGQRTDAGPGRFGIHRGASMGRHAKDLPTDHVNSRVVDFAAALRRLRRKAGQPTLAVMAKQSGFSTASLSAAAGGYVLPSWRVTTAYVEACGADPQTWRGRWEAVRRELRPQEFMSDESVDSLNLDPEQRRRASWKRTWERWDRTGVILPPHRAETALYLRIALQSLRAYRSLSLRQLAQLMPYSHSTVAAALSGARPVSAQFLSNFLQACGATTFSERVSWLNLLASANPDQQRAAESSIAASAKASGGRFIAAQSWRSALPTSSEISRLKSFSIRKRSEHLRDWLMANLSNSERRALYRRAEKVTRVSAAQLSLFERGEWNLTLKQLNYFVKEAQVHGFEDIDPVIESGY